MLKIAKTNYKFLAPIIVTMAMALSACGEDSMIPNTTVYRFDHRVPESFSKKKDLSLDEFKPFMDDGVFFWGGATRNTDNVSDIEFNIGVQFHAETEGRRIFIEKVALDTPNLKTERIVNVFVDIDIPIEKSKIYFKRFMPFENIPGDSIPLTAEFFTLKIDYKLDDRETKQMSIRFDNAAFKAPVL